MYFIIDLAKKTGTNKGEGASFPSNRTQVQKGWTIKKIIKIGLNINERLWVKIESDGCRFLLYGEEKCYSLSIHFGRKNKIEGIFDLCKLQYFFEWNSLATFDWKKIF